MLNDYMAEFRSLHAELELLLGNAESGKDSQTAIERKLREIKGKALQHSSHAFC